MPISSLVATLEPDEAQAEEALASLRANPHFEVGEPTARRVPLVLEAPNQSENLRSWDALKALPGVAAVELLWIHLDTDERPQ